MSAFKMVDHLNEHANVSEQHLGGYMYGGDPATYYPVLWKTLINTFTLTSILDVGCGEGYAVQFFINNHCPAIGIDGSKQALARSAIANNLVLHDFCTGPYKPNAPVDAVWSCEFVEHVDENYASHFLQTFASATKYIFMTHGVPGQEGWHHVNCQVYDYWIHKLAQVGFRLSPTMTTCTRILAVNGYYAQNGLAFVRQGYTPRRRQLFRLIVAAMNPMVLFHFLYCRARVDQKFGYLINLIFPWLYGKLRQRGYFKNC